MTLPDWLAVYAAVLSTAIFARDLVVARPRLRVRLLPGITANGDFGVHISIQNTSAHAIRLAGLSVLLPHRKATAIDWIGHIVRYHRWPSNVGWVHTRLSAFAIEDGLPCTIEAHAAHDIHVPQRAVARMLEGAPRREIRIGIQDALWRNTYSRVLKVDWRDDQALRRSDDT